MPLRSALPVLIVYNPASGGGRGERSARELEQALARRDLASLRLKTQPGCATFAEIEPERYRAIAILGGDGSLHAALNGLSDLAVPLAFVGAGTVNVTSRELGLPSAPEAVADLIAAGRFRRIPLWSAGGRRFALFAETGFMGGAVGQVNAWRARNGRHGRAEFVCFALAALSRCWGRGLEVQLVDADGQLHNERYSNVLLTRVRRYAGHLKMPVDRALKSPIESDLGLLVGYRTRTPLGHGLVLGLACLGLLPVARPLLERLGLLRCRMVERARIESRRPAATHADAETEFPGGPLVPPLEFRPAGIDFQLLVPD